MRVNAPFLQPQNSFINAPRINASLAKQNPGAQQAGKPNRDRVTLSPQAKMMNMIENLTQQKKTITENRNNLIKENMENGGDREALKAQLKVYDGKLEDLDKQISSLYAQQAKQTVEEMKPKESKKSETDKDKDTVRSEQVLGLSQVSEGLKQAQQISAVQSRVENEVLMERSEAHMSKLYMERLESRGLGSNIRVEKLIENEERIFEKKMETVSDLQQKASELGSIELRKINQTMQELEEAEETEQNEKTDEPERSENGPIPSPNDKTAE